MNQGMNQEAKATTPTTNLHIGRDLRPIICLPSLRQERIWGRKESDEDEHTGPHPVTAEITRRIQM